ncbi:dihydrofolate reductase family protein [Anaerosporobacter faecicola]|uniref:dihydrofolate reductase family protein n=1 Tax=Anaerosporobacter faecicola TaxID=2718714 RepID=UPI00143AC282|nr:dihydrofolate reductase family protein [Anaerosporobacter faecicola]
MCKRPITTLYMLSSVDGKISTGNTSELDVDQDFPNIDGVKEGLHQYYDIEKTTDLWSLNSGFVQAKIGVNEDEYPEKTPVSFVVIDNKNLTEHGVMYFSKLAKTFVLVTTNKNHPAFSIQEDNVHILYQEKLDLKAMLEELYEQFHCERITIQTGGTLNGLFLREKLFDFVDLVYAPILIGGKDTPTLVDGEAISKKEALKQLGVLHLEHCDILKDSYIRLRYRVIS